MMRDVQPSRESQHHYKPMSSQNIIAEPPTASSHGCHIKRPSSTATLNILLIFSFILICLCSSTTALEAAMPIQTALDLASFAEPGILVVDQRSHPNPRLAHNHDLRRRKDDAEKTSTTATTLATRTASSLITSTTPTASPTSSTTTKTTKTTSSSTTLPSPFEGSLGNNFTVSACPDFIDEFISTAAFKACSPFSLLLQTSTSFFNAQKSPVLLTETLDASCAANVTECTNYLNTVANNLTSEANCKADLALGNPIVIEARDGLIAYQTLYEASCLHNPTTSSYCAVDAFTNTSSPTDSYVYYLPLAMNLPGGATPTCDSCLQNTMQIYQKASANQTQPIFNTYASAAEQINVICGPMFVNASIPAPMSSGAGMSSKIGSGEGVGALILVLVVALWMF